MGAQACASIVSTHSTTLYRHMRHRCQFVFSGVWFKRCRVLTTGTPTPHTTHPHTRTHNHVQRIRPTQNLVIECRYETMTHMAQIADTVVFVNNAEPSRL